MRMDIKLKVRIIDARWKGSCKGRHLINRNKNRLTAHYLKVILNRDYTLNVSAS